MKLHAVTAAAILLGMAPIHAQTPPVAPPITAQTVAGAPIEMKLRLTPGETRAYKITVNQDGTITLPGAGQGMPLQTGITAFAKLFVDQQNPDGTYAVRYKVGGMKMTMNGQPMTLPGIPESWEMKGTVSKDGIFKASGDSAASMGAMAMGMDPNQMMSNVFANMMNVPDRAVQIGDTWIVNIPVPMDPTGGSTISVSNKVVGMDTVKGESVARIQRDTTGPVNLTLSQPMPMTIKGTMKGSGVTKVATKTGHAMDDDSTTSLDAEITMDNPAGNGERTTMKLAMVVKARVESTVLTASPAATPATPAKPAATRAAKPAKTK